MADIEKVIMGLECCSTGGLNCKEGNCPYWSNDDCLHDIEKDALELLKEQEEKRAKAYEILLDLSNVTKDIDDTLLSAMDYLMPDEEANK